MHVREKQSRRRFFRWLRFWEGDHGRIGAARGKRWVQPHLVCIGEDRRSSRLAGSPRARWVCAVHDQ